MENKRYELFCKIMSAMDVAYDYMFEYDSMPHKYGDEILYQAETHIIQIIGEKPGITITEIAAMTSKTTSACSQLVRKLRAKNWVEQIRNEKNNREYNLNLTETGWNVYNTHEEFDKKCFECNSLGLSEFTDEELNTYLKVQNKINKLFEGDVERSKKNNDILL